MPKRIAAALLWFYSAWTAWSFASWALGLDPLLATLSGPFVGAVAAGLFAGDPRRIIWTPRTEATAQAPRRKRLADPA
jgi:hypothetical protein